MEIYKFMEIYKDLWRLLKTFIDFKDLQKIFKPDSAVFW